MLIKLISASASQIVDQPEIETTVSNISQLLKSNNNSFQDAPSSVRSKIRAELRKIGIGALPKNVVEITTSYKLNHPALAFHLAKVDRFTGDTEEVTHIVNFDAKGRIMFLEEDNGGGDLYYQSGRYKPVGSTEHRNIQNVSELRAAFKDLCKQAYLLGS